MRTFLQHLKQHKQICKAVREYKSERRWFGDEWYINWATVSVEVEAAIKKYYGL